MFTRLQGENKAKKLSRMIALNTILDVVVLHPSIHICTTLGVYVLYLFMTVCTITLEVYVLYYM